MSAWKAYQPTNDMPWNWQRVVHLHRRTGWGATWDVVQRDLHDGPDAAIDQVLQGDSVATAEGFEQTAAIIAEAAITSGDPTRLKAWWLYRMLATPHPLREKMTLLWHNHFATSNLKVRNLRLMYQQNQIQRQGALGNFGELLERVLKHSAMLQWLDANANRSSHPNENLARELFELFTLGTGNYSESDVREAARALTGWTVIRGQFHWQPDRHDSSNKTILGTTQPWDGDRLLSHLTAHGATCRRVAWRLCRCLLSESVCDDAAIEELAAGLKHHDLDLGWAVASIIRSERFFFSENLRGRVSSPVEYVVSAIRSLKLTQPLPSTVSLAGWCARMGQDLFYPPNVGGWREGHAWLTTRTIVARANFAFALASGQLQNAPNPAVLEQLAQQRGGQRNAAAIVEFVARLLLGTELDNATVNQILADAADHPAASRDGRIVARVLSHPWAYLT